MAAIQAPSHPEAGTNMLNPRRTFVGPSLVALLLAWSACSREEAPAANTGSPSLGPLSIGGAGVGAAASMIPGVGGGIAGQGGSAASDSAASTTAGPGGGMGGIG